MFGVSISVLLVRRLSNPASTPIITTKEPDDYGLKTWREQHGRPGGEANRDEQIELEAIRAVESPAVTHLKYRVVR